MNVFHLQDQIMELHHWALWISEVEIDFTTRKELNVYVEEHMHLLGQIQYLVVFYSTN